MSADGGGYSQGQSGRLKLVSSRNWDFIKVSLMGSDGED